MDKNIKARQGWVNLYIETGNAGLVCRKCGISRPTLRKWVRRFKEVGLDGLKELSRRPKHSPNRKIFELQEKLILNLRAQRNLGARGIKNELLRRTSANTLHFIDRLLEEMPFPIQRIQSDRGREFFAVKV